MSPSASHLKLTQVNAFTRTPFDGARVAVCILSEGQSRLYDDERLAKVAAEFGTPETAFAVKTADSAYALRSEATLSAVLAVAHVLWGEGHAGHAEKLTIAGHAVRKRADHMAIDCSVQNEGVLIRDLDGAAELSAFHCDASSLLFATCRVEKSLADFACRAFGPAGELAKIPFAHALLGAHWLERLPSALLLGEQRYQGRVAKIHYERGQSPSSLVIAGQAATTLKGFLVAAP